MNINRYEKDEVSIYKELAVGLGISVISIATIKLIPMLVVGTTATTKGIAWLCGGKYFMGIMIPNYFKALVIAMFGADVYCALKKDSNYKKARR